MAQSPAGMGSRQRSTKSLFAATTLPPFLECLLRLEAAAAFSGASETRPRESCYHGSSMVTRVPLRAVIFDWDGTLLDSYSADTNAYLQMFRAMGIPWGIADLERHYSPDWYNVYRAAELPMDRWREADRLWRHFYRSERPRLRPGARQVIEYLRSRYRLA